MKIGPFQFSIKKSEMTKELGHPGTSIFNGQVSDEDYVSELTGSSALETYNKMRRSDGVVKAALLACELPIRAANWYVTPASEDEKDIEVADFVSHNLFEAMSITWDDFLRQALLCLPFGFSVFEKVFKPVDFNGQQMIGWKKFSPRLQTTIFQWETESGEDGITQQLVTGRRVSIPIEKLLIFTYQKEGDNWLGTSILRSAYRSWFFKSHIEKINAMAFERQGLGIPYGILPRNATSEDRDKMEELLKNIRANEQSYLIQPENWEIEFKDMKAGTLKDPDETIRRYNREILISVLAQFLDLGSGSTGSRALSTDHSSVFHNSLAAVAKMIQDVINKYAIKQLVDLNYTVSEYPSLEYSYVGIPRYKDISEALSKLIQTGAINSDKGLESHLRQIMDLPEKDEESEGEEPKEEPKEEPGEEQEEMSEKKTFSEFTPFRKLTFAEKKVNFSDIHRKMEEATNKLRIELGKIVKKSADDLIRQFEMVLESPSNKEKRERLKKINVKYKSEYRKALYNSVLNMFQYGKMMAAHEMKKEVPPTPSKSLSIISGLADSLTEIMADDLMKEGKLTLLNELQKKQFNFSEALNNVISNIRASGKSIVMNAAAINIGGAINQGRRASLTAYKDDIYALQRSEILDSVTCEYCMSIDGRTFRKNDAFTKTDSIHSFCRGIWVEIMKEEKEKPAISGMPKTLRERFKSVNKFNPPKHPIIKKDSLAAEYLRQKNQK
jgi:phage gp29-like protein